MSCIIFARKESQRNDGAASFLLTGSALLRQSWFREELHCQDV